MFVAQSPPYNAVLTAADAAPAKTPAAMRTGVAVPHVAMMTAATTTAVTMAGRARTMPLKSFLKNFPKLKKPLGSMRLTGLFWRSSGVHPARLYGDD